MDTIKVIEESASAVTIESMSPLIREEYFLNLTRENHLGFASASIFDKLYDVGSADVVLREIPKMKELSLRKIIQLAPQIGIDVTVIIDVNKIPSASSVKVRFDRPVRVARLRKFNTEPADTELIVSGLTMKRIKFIPPIDISMTMVMEDAIKFIYREHQDIIDLGNNPDVINKVDQLLASMINLIMFSWPSVINIARDAAYKRPAGIIAQSTESEFDWLYTSMNNELFSPREMYKFVHVTDPVVEENKAILDAISNATGVKLSSTCYDSVVQQLSDLSLDKIYYDVRYGRVKDINTTVTAYKNMIAQAKHRAIVKEKVTTEINLAQVYLRIIEKRLPKKYTSVSKLVSPDAILKQLTEQERKLVLLEYEQRLKYITAQLNNKCEHVPVLRKFRRATDDGSLFRAYNDLKKYISGEAKHGGDDSDDFIHCNICKFPLICEHVRIYTELTLKHAQYAEIKAALSPYIAQSRELGTDPHCKVCGAIISTDLLGSLEIPDFTMDDELKKFIYGEIMGLMRYMSFAVLVNVPQTVSMIRDACYPYVFDLEKRIIKSKTASADEVKAKMKLYASIYIIAYLVHLSIKNPNTVSFKGYTNKDKNPVVGLIKRAIEIILESKNTIIRFVPNTNADVIKNSIISAYKSITTVKIAVEGDVTHIPIEYDPIYQYVESMSSLSSVKKPKNPDDIGKHIDKPEELLSIEIKSKGKKSSNETSSMFKNVRYSDAGSQPNLPGMWEDDIAWKKVQSWLSKRSYECMMRYVQTGIYKEPVYMETGTAGKSELALNIDLVAWYDTITTLNTADAAAKNSALLRSSPNFSRPKKLNDRPWKYIDIPLGRIYDADGKLHKWNVFVIDGKDVPYKDVTGQGRDVDVKCGVCGVLKSEADSIDSELIKESLDMLNKQDNFYRFYDTRCPEGGLHDMKDGTCSVCGYDHKHSMSYFKKYAKKYESERKSLLIIPEITKLTAVKSADYSSDYSEWSFNFNSILYIADTFKVNQKAITALGATNGVDYDAILNGSYIPNEAESPDDTRIYALNSHMINLIREYNQVRNFSRILKPSPSLTALMEQYAPKHLINNLHELLDPIDESYKQRFEWFRLHKKPRETVSWLLQWLCDTMSKITGTGTPETSKLRHAFVSAYINKLITNDMTVAKYKHFNWALIYGEKEEKTRDQNFVADADEESDDEGEESGPMSTEAYDMEDDGDPDGNQVRVGENYGLD